VKVYNKGKTINPNSQDDWSKYEDATLCVTEDCRKRYGFPFLSGRVTTEQKNLALRGNGIKTIEISSRRTGRERL
jgi:hypothetical protein